MITHIAAVACTLAIYLLTGLAYFGWGKASLTLVRISEHTADCIMPVWLGWALTLIIFQTLHLFFPITAYVVVPILVIGVVLSIRHVVNALRVFPKEPTRLIVHALAVVLGLGVAAWVASRAMLPPTHWDAGLYHFNAIRWINTYHLVPGLGNLHGRLAFNQSFFTYVAALNFHPFFGHGRSLANSFLSLLLVATLLPSLRSVLTRPAVLTERHVFFYAPGLFVLPMVVYLALCSRGLGSPDADLASTLLQLVMFVMLTRGTAEWLEGQRDQDQRAVVLAVLAATAVTVKLSNLVFSAVIIGVSLAYAWQKPRLRLQAAARLVLPVAVIVLVWAFRGIMLSGAPLYPSTIGYVPVEWAVPREKVVAEADFVYSWARQREVPPSSVLGRWDWLGPWSRRMKNSFTEVLYPVALAVLFSITAVTVGVFSYLRGRSRPRHLEWSIPLAPSILGLVYWFFTAPDPRLAGALVWLLSLNSTLLLLSFLRTIVSGRVLLAAACVTFVVANLHLARRVLVDPEIGSISHSGWQPVKRVPLVMKTTLSGLAVCTPERVVLAWDSSLPATPSDPRISQCWDSPLPSTPCFNPDLRLRTPGKMASGFTVLKVDDSCEL